MMVGSCSILGVDATLGNVHEIWENLHNFKKLKCLLVIPKLCRWLNKTWEATSLTDGNSLVVMAVGYLIWALRSILRRGQFSTLLLWSLCSEPIEA